MEIFDFRISLPLYIVRRIEEPNNYIYSGGQSQLKCEMDGMLSGKHIWNCSIQIIWELLCGCFRLLLLLETFEP